MDNPGLEKVKEVFGTNFQQYCIRHKILLKEDKCGAFMTLNVHNLKECVDVLESYKLKLNNRLNAIQAKKSFNTQNHGNHSMQGLQRHYTKNNKRNKKLSAKKTTNVNSKSVFNNLNLDINLYDTSSVVPSHTPQSSKINCILNTNQSGHEIFEYIIKETSKDIVINDYEDCIPSISLLLEQFQRQHKKFHYCSILKQLLQKEELNLKLKCKYQVTTKQLKSFFNIVFAKVVPLNIFGKLRNLKKIKKAMYCLMHIPRFKSFNLMPFITKIDVSNIIWLNCIKNIRIQRLVLVKFVKWFFTGFLIKILRINLHVTSISATNNEKLYIIRSNWCNLQKKYINKKIHSNVLQPYIPSNEWNPQIGIYTLYPKYSGMRPIFVSQWKEKDKNDLKIILKFLRQLYITEYGTTSFEEKWKSIVTHRNNLQNEELYFVSSDVTDAFGSIIQSHLYDIILSLCEKLPENLAFKYYWMKSKNSSCNDVICCKQYFCNTNLQLPFQRGTLYACTNHTTQWIQKNWLLNKICKYIFHQRVQIGKQIYSIGKGIVQGTMLSPILSDIYYNFVLCNYMTKFMNSGEVTRYMDDILYVTGNITMAKEFLQLTKRGISRYNCHFKKLKTQSSIAYGEEAAVKNITYIGYKINCQTLELQPKHPNTDIRYLISFKVKHNTSPLRLFKKRLNNMSHLKLSKIVLSSGMNSKAGIDIVLKDACLIQAKRAQVLINELFYNIPRNMHKILEIIESSNKNVAKHVIRTLVTLNECMTDLDVYKWNKKILLLLQKSFKIVFKKDQILRKCLINIRMK